jgi:ribosome-associated protein
MTSVPENEAPDDGQISKSQRKRDADRIREFAASLVGQSPQKLKRLPISDHVRQAIAACPPASTRGAYKRHIQYIGKLLRKEGDVELLQQMLEEPPAATNPHQQFCDQLIASFTTHADTLRLQYPSVSLQQARQLAKTARTAAGDDEDEQAKKIAGQKAGKARRALLKLLSNAAGQESAR